TVHLTGCSSLYVTFSLFFDVIEIQKIRTSNFILSINNNSYTDFLFPFHSTKAFSIIKVILN
ncbi:MAG TPA: hypothetical protein VIM70_11175, partial [Clostridium sp.]|uniref:hypothetical protein n=1 Tax=Clostridium sp. TaxID=1506 RepID=UPI002F9381C3